MGIAFIQDKLEIKFLILYIAARLTEPVDGAALQDSSRPPVSLLFSLPCSSFVIRFSPLGTGRFSRYATAARRVHSSGCSRCVHLNTPPAACKAVQATSCYFFHYKSWKRNRQGNLGFRVQGSS